MKIFRTQLNVRYVIMLILMVMLKYCHMSYYHDHCYIPGKYGGSAHRNCNVNVKFNHIFPVVFHNLINYDSYLIIKELGQFNLKTNIVYVTSI